MLRKEESGPKKDVIYSDADKPPSLCAFVLPSWLRWHSIQAGALQPTSTRKIKLCINRSGLHHAGRLSSLKCIALCSLQCRATYVFLMGRGLRTTISSADRTMAGSSQSLNVLMSITLSFLQQLGRWFIALLFTNPEMSQWNESLNFLELVCGILKVLIIWLLYPVYVNGSNRIFLWFCRTTEKETGFSLGCMCHQVTRNTLHTFIFTIVAY